MRDTAALIVLLASGVLVAAILTLAPGPLAVGVCEHVSPGGIVALASCPTTVAQAAARAPAPVAGSTRPATSVAER